MISQFRMPKRFMKNISSGPDHNDLTLDDIIDVKPIEPPQPQLGGQFLKTEPLGAALRNDSDFNILETLKVIRLKKSWDINEATLALKEACIAEWERRYGPGAFIPDVELSKEAMEQIKFEKEFHP